MIESETIVVGGGPAGSTCAWKLRQAGRQVIILDRKPFPRPKPCAGWITPRVLADLQILPSAYPLTLARYDRLYFHCRRVTIPLPTRQYAIRRLEFDHWLLQRAGVPVHHHGVKEILQNDGAYIVDGLYRCRFLVGAGGTYCPVYRTLFRKAHPRADRLRIVAMEDEVVVEHQVNQCHLWFCEQSGYSWYVPKGGTYINIGTGVLAADRAEGGGAIQDSWHRLVRKLADRSLQSGVSLHPTGHTYYLRDGDGPVQLGHAFVVGDAAGLATRDMGEGIGPAVRSGILAAEAIIRGTTYTVRSIPRYSVFSLLAPGREAGGA